MRRLVVVLGQSGTSQVELLARIEALPADVATTLVSCVTVDAELAKACQGVVLLAGARVHADAGTGAAAGVAGAGESQDGGAPPRVTASAQQRVAAVVQHRPGARRKLLLPTRLLRAGARIIRRGFLKVGGATARGILRQLSGLRLSREVKRNRDVRALARGCDVMCAADGVAIVAVWSLAGKFPSPRAVLGVAAADYEFRRGVDR
ncbi:MAG: hypothetical protein KGP01_06815 [Actinomycetales bacterium]|nr:hypothetical protein [Actinomycetales bacterium]